MISVDALRAATMKRPTRKDNSWLVSDEVKPFNSDEPDSSDAGEDSDGEQTVSSKKNKEGLSSGGDNNSKKGVSGPPDAYGVDKKILRKFMKRIERDREAALTEPLPVGLILQCRVQRKGETYFLNLDMPSLGSADDVKSKSQVLVNDFLLASKKRKHKEPPTYIFCMDRRDISRHSESYVGKLKSDIRGLTYHIFDKGERPSGSTFDPAGDSVRCELGIMEYKSNVLGTRSPRKLKMYLPPITSDGKVTIHRPKSTSSDAGIRGSGNNQKPPFKLMNKKPVWNEKTQSYQLNYYGRASVASVKNFQLVHPETPEQVFLQLGKISNNTFILDFQYPFSPLLAFATAIGSFSSKRMSD